MPKEDPKEKEKEISRTAPATIVVNLPADATLSIDENRTRSTTGNRRFVTPSLQRDKEYYYTLKAEVVRDGKTITASKRVMVRGGQESRVTLEIAIPETVAQK